MVEANRRLQETTDRAQRAAIVLARQRAIKEAKRQFQKQGLKPQHIARKVIVVAADEYLAEHRAELISEATEIVERWRVEGFFGKKAALSVRKLPQLRTLTGQKERRCRGNSQ